MTTEDYISIAAAIREATLTIWAMPICEREKIMAEVIAEIARTLKADNSRFDREIFYAACLKGTPTA